MSDRNQKMRRIITVAVAASAIVAIPAAYVGATHTFTDVPTSAFYHNAVSAISDAGITSGCGGTKYCPGSVVTRGQMAVFMNKLGALSPGVTPVVDALSDQGTVVIKFAQEFTLAGGTATECEAGDPSPLTSADPLTVQHQLYAAPISTALVNVQLRDDGDPTDGYQVCFAKLGGGTLTAGTYSTFGTYTGFIGTGLFASAGTASEARETARTAGR